MPNAGLTDSRRAVWVYMPGHSWRARKRAELFAEKSGLSLAEKPAARRMMNITPEHRPPGLYEVFIFELSAN